MDPEAWKQMFGVCLVVSVHINTQRRRPLRGFKPVVTVSGGKSSSRPPERSYACPLVGVNKGQKIVFCC